MIELNRLDTEYGRLIEVKLFFPWITSRMILNDKAMLVDESWNMDFLEKKQIPAFQVSEKDLLQGKITGITSKAEKAGISVGMRGWDGFAKMDNSALHSHCPADIAEPESDPSFK